MKITSVTISNFRSYKEPLTIKFDDLTVFVGRNDIGKSTILEALDIFFNDGRGIIKIDKADLNVESVAIGNRETTIAVTFSELPENVIIDAAYTTTLESEYLLNSNNELEVVKKYGSSHFCVYKKKRIEKWT